MANYAAYGPNPNFGRSPNAENGWGSYKWPGGVPQNLLGTAQYGGVKLVVRKELVELTNLLLKLTEDKHRYNLYGPSEKPPAGWCWGYSNRPIAGTSTASNHSKGRAVDLNAPNNPYTSPLVCDFPPAMVKDWEECGWYWGGRYNGSKDAMHFEYAYTPNDVQRHTALAKSKLGGTTPVPPTEEDWLDMATQKEVEQAFSNALNKWWFNTPGMPAQPNSPAENTTEARRMAGVAIGYPPAKNSPEYNLARNPK